ncbi:MAG TPA: tetratricopeptide repeat protein [Gemmatimonadaceae bacterium]
MAVFGKNLFASGLLLLAATAAGAQQTTAPACDVGSNAKGNLGKASLAVDLARQTGPGPAAESQLKNTVKLVESSPNEDPVTRAWLLGEALSLWLNQPNVGLSPTRGTVGFTSNPTASIDLIGTVDSLFKVVEQAKPNCTDFTAYYRGGQKFYLDLANAAINALNADKLDSAEYYATQAHRIYPASPYGTMVLGNVYSKRGDNAKAVAYWRAASEAAAKDTSYRDVHRQMLSNVGTVYLNRANAASGAARTADADSAAAAFAALLEIPGTTGPYLYGTRQTYQTALLMAGDTAKFVASYQPLIQNPSAYSYQDLLNSAVNAARAEKAQDAAKLFAATLDQNPYNRDALFNLAVTYLTLEQNDKVTPIVTRLVAVDPGNPENFNLAARAYLAQGKAAQAKKNTAVAAAYNDSTLAWYTRGNKLPVEVSLSEFTPTEKDITLVGTVLDRRDKIDPASGTTAAKGKTAKGAKAGTPKFDPKPVTLNFEAIDKSGAVLGTQSVTTEALTPGKSASFRVVIPAANAVAYRYTIAP